MTPRERPAVYGVTADGATLVRSGTSWFACKGSARRKLTVRQAALLAAQPGAEHAPGIAGGEEFDAFVLNYKLSATVKTFRTGVLTRQQKMKRATRAELATALAAVVSACSAPECSAAGDARALLSEDPDFRALLDS